MDFADAVELKIHLAKTNLTINNLIRYATQKTEDEACDIHKKSAITIRKKLMEVGIVPEKDFTTPLPQIKKTKTSQPGLNLGCK